MRSNKLYYAILALITTFFHMSSYFSADCYFMTAHGRDMLANGFQRSTDIFTVHNFDFMYTKWAMCILTKLIYDSSGEVGLMVAAYVLMFITMAVFAFVLYSLNPQKPIFNAVVLCLIAACVAPVSSFRPHMIACILLAFFLLTMERFIEKPKTSHYVIFFIISLALMWFHTTMWVVLPIFMMPYVCDIKPIRKILKLDLDVPDKKNLAKAFLCITAGSLLQPCGIKIYSYIWTCCTALSGPYQEYIGEMRPHPGSFSNICLYIVLMIGVIDIIQTKKFKLRALYMMIGGLLLILISFRFIPYSACIILFGIALNHQFSEISIPKKTVVAMLCGISIIASFWAYEITSNSEGLEKPTESASKTAIDWLYERDKDATLCCLCVNAGSYAMTKNYKVYMDCRAEVYDIKLNHKKDVLTEYCDLVYGSYKGNSSKTYMKDFQKDYNFDYYVIAYFDEFNLVNKRIEQTAKCIYKDKYSAIYTYK